MFTPALNKHYVILSTQVNTLIALIRREALALTKASSFPINSVIFQKHASQIPRGRPGVR